MRIGVLRRAVPVLLLALLSAAAAHAQLRDWRAYPSMREVKAIAASDDAMWAATTGGVYAFVPPSGEVTRYTPVQGLHGVEAATLAYDAARGAVWIGYPDGVLDRLDVASGAVRSFFDIARADQFSARGVRRLRVHGETLYVATAFGLVVFDLAREEVRETYARLGPLDPATPVNDALVAPLPDGRPGLWVATTAGVVYAALDAPNLQQPAAWTRDSAAPAASGCLAAFEGGVVACAAEGAVRRNEDGSWTTIVFWGSPARDLLVDGEYIYAAVGGAFFRGRGDGRWRTYILSSYDLLTSVALGPDGALWVGSELDGLVQVPPLGSQTGEDVIEIMPARVVVPEGPFNNIILALASDVGEALWVVNDRVLRPPPGQALAAVSRLEGGTWTTYVEGVHDIPSSRLISAAVAPDGTFYAASVGKGLLAITPDGQAVTYDHENSSLLLRSGTEFVEVGDAVPDAEGRVWVTNKFASVPLHVRSPDGAWKGLSRPPGMPTSLNLLRMGLDPFGQKWFTARLGDDAAGVVAYSTGADPLDASDDQFLHISQVGTNGTGLPSAEARALTFDAQGRLWIGTRRGLAIVFTPGAAFGGDPALVTPQWARTADGLSYLLRDLNVNDFAVDPAGQIWIGSTTGAWLLNAAGDTVLLHLTSQNTPLFSDNVVAVDVDAATGRVYFATDRGILSAAGEATAPSASVRALTVAPSPYRPAQHARGVLISGLVAETTVYVLTPDGQRVAALEARGGSVRWDGRDERTGAPVASGVYLVAAVAADGEGTAYGKVAVIR